MNFVGVGEQLAGNECPASKNHWQFWRTLSLWVITYNQNSFLSLAPKNTKWVFYKNNHWRNRPVFLWGLSAPTALASSGRQQTLYFGSYFFDAKMICRLKASAEVNQLLYGEVGTWSCDFRPSKNKWILRYSFLHVNFIYLQDSSPGHHCTGDWELGWGISCLRFTVCFAQHWAVSPTYSPRFVGRTWQLIFKNNLLHCQFATGKLSKT